MATRANQPQYDFLTGGPPPQGRQPLRESINASQAGKVADPAQDDVRGRVYKLEYEIESLKQERDLTALRHQEDLRAAQSRAEQDYKRAQASESSSHSAVTKADGLARELQEAQERAEEERSEFDRRLRSVQDENHRLQEESEESREQAETLERQLNHDLRDLKTKHDHLLRQFEELRLERDNANEALERERQKLKERESRTAELENELLRSRTQSGGLEEFAVIKRELSDQVAHLQKLEAENVDLKIRQKQWETQKKSVEVVEEEKRALESQIKRMDDLRKELSEAQVQKQILQDERNTWTAYLENMSSADEDLQFETPEDLAKAYVQERLECVSLVEQLGKVTPDLSAKDSIIQSLEEEKQNIRTELEKVRTSGAGGDSKSHARLERQRALAAKEVDYLRAQLKALDEEKNEFNPEQYDAQKSVRITELETLVDQYKDEIKALHADSDRQSGSSLSITGSKRQREDEPKSDERLGELFRKNRALQDEVQKITTSRSMLEKELEATRSQLSSAKSSSRTRILELRSNPTAESETVKLSTMKTLREENIALLDQLEKFQRKSGSGGDSKKSLKHADKDKLIPQATLERLRADLVAKDKALADAEKHHLRLKNIFASKSGEFREAVASLLGWKLDIMPNGKTRVTSMYHLGKESGGDGDNNEEKSIVFDGENGTMKVSGGPRSKFAAEIRELIDFWVDGRKEIPCFLAAATLEFWEKQRGTMKV